MFWFGLCLFVLVCVVLLCCCDVLWFGLFRCLFDCSFGVFCVDDVLVVLFVCLIVCLLVCLLVCLFVWSGLF